MDLSETITEACRRRGVRKLVIPPGLPKGWIPEGVETLRDAARPRLTKEELDESDGVLTGCSLGIAQTELTPAFLKQLPQLPQLLR